MTVVDLHHHAPLASYVRRLGAIGVQAQPGSDFPAWHPDDSRRLMAELGIDVAVLSVGSPGFFFGDQNFTTDLVRDVNDELREIVADSDGHFAALACLPLPSVEAALTELSRVWGHPEFVGVTLLSSYAGHYLGHPSFDPLLAELDSRHAVVHMHPKLPAAWPEGELPLPPSVLEYLFDSTRTITSLMLARVSERYPGIRWIFSHCGGAMPAAVTRMVMAEGAIDPARLPDGGFRGALGRFWFDTALSTTAADLGALRTVVDDTRFVLGSDFPFSPAATVRRAFSELADLVGPGLLQSIRAENYGALLPDLGQKIGPDEP
jgi:predicted TIM-barrel fold metal-dependent hydrolase